MKSSNKSIKEAFSEVFNFDNPIDQNEVDTHVLIAKFLSVIQDEADQQSLTRKELAQMIGTSPSYLTQVFRGNKLLNMSTIAKFQRALGFDFQISSNLSTKSFPPFEEIEMKNFLDKWFEDKNTGEYIKIVKTNTPSTDQSYLPTVDTINAA